MPKRIAFLVACLASVACSDRAPDRTDSGLADSISRARQDSINRSLPGYVVDSIRPVEEELRRFRKAVGGDSVIALTGGGRTRDDLVRRFVEAVAAADTIRLRSLGITPREFADLLYPESPYTRPPYRQAPALVWSQIEASGATGLTRLLRRLGGQSLQYVSHECAARPEVRGSSTIWNGCAVRARNSAGEMASGRLFGSIVERDGRFKFINYANDF